MRTTMKILFGLSSVLAMSAAASAATLMPIVPYPGATSTSVFGIADDNNTITGSYVDQNGLTHGFYGTLNGSYHSFDFGNSGATQARAIDSSGTLITGFANISADHCSFEEFEMKVGHHARAITWDGTPLNGEAQGLNTRGRFAGDYCDLGGSGTIYGMAGHRAKYKRTVSTPFPSSYTGERAVNNAFTFAGFYIDDSTGFQVGTLIKSGITQQITYPADNESYTVLEGLNNAGMAAGQWGDTDGVTHSFSYDSTTGTYVEIDDPAAGSFTQAWGVNNSGLIAVTSDAGAYIYCPDDNNCPGNGAKIAAHPVSSTAALRHANAQKKSWHAVPSQHKLPKGAAVQ